MERALDRHRVPFAPVLTIEQAMNHPHLSQRRTVRTIQGRFLGEFEIPGFSAVRCLIGVRVTGSGAGLAFVGPGLPHGS